MRPPGRRAWRPAAGLLASAVLLLAGCGTGHGRSVISTGHGAPPSSAPAPGAAALAGLCPDGITRLAARRVPAGFVAVAAYECTRTTEAVAGRGVWVVELERRATAGLQPLLAALRRPDQPPPKPGVACPASILLVAPIALQDRSGGLLRPALPLDQCHQPQAGAVQAIEKLAWKTVARQLVRPLQSPAEASSGCVSDYKDVFDLLAAHLQPGPAGPPVTGRPSGLTVCVYRDRPSTNHPVGPTGPAAALPLGTLVGGGRVTGAEVAVLLEGLSAGRASAGCPVAHPEFAVLRPAGGGADAYVEVGGCERVLKFALVTDQATQTAKEQDMIGQATPKAVALIEAAAAQNG